MKKARFASILGTYMAYHTYSIYKNVPDVLKILWKSMRVYEVDLLVPSGQANNPESRAPAKRKSSQRGRQDLFQ